ncbi:hypothetical protein FEM48_Zijuj06G0117100 [Ziziphus jujuba var. spinosa]|uniref:Uncharacterized protein n=1 Tax=Ziziphus jujuba var. spinosa TaxID=714518 RepID=A0A978V933_ZIZJJ|nr:hypothetical protein FEM48_Zijuj06G0117100 [Ziziphus jujuba var. spinosa]
MSLPAIRTLSSMSLENWELKLSFSRVWGFRRMIYCWCSGGCPKCLLYLRGKLRSVELRLKPRLRILEILKKKNHLHKLPSLTTTILQDL